LKFKQKVPRTVPDIYMNDSPLIKSYCQNEDDLYIISIINSVKMVFLL